MRGFLVCGVGCDLQYHNDSIVFVCYEYATTVKKHKMDLLQKSTSIAAAFLHRYRHSAADTIGNESITLHHVVVGVPVGARIVFSRHVVVVAIFFAGVVFAWDTLLVL